MNLIEGLKELSWLWNCSRSSRGSAVQVLSTQFFQNGTGIGNEDMAFSSTSPITEFDTVTETREPMAMSKVCWKYLPRNATYMASKQNFDNYCTSSGDRAVRSSSDLLFLICSSAIRHSSSTGTFVKSETTSKETNIASEVVVW